MITIQFGNDTCSIDRGQLVSCSNGGAQPIIDDIIQGWGGPENYTNDPDRELAEYVLEFIDGQIIQADQVNEPGNGIDGAPGELEDGPAPEPTGDLPKVLATIETLGAEANLQLDGWHSDDSEVESILENIRYITTVNSWEPNPWAVLVKATISRLPAESKIIYLYEPPIVIDPRAVY